MSLVIFVDTGPLGLITNPKVPPETAEILAWTIDMRRAGHRFIVPAIADFEVRRELTRAGKTAGLRGLDNWIHLEIDRYLPLSDTALKLASHLWAQARNSGTATADPKELDGDVLIASQAIDFGLPPSQYVVATINVGHFSQFVPARNWRTIR
ncbi:MAG: type II toxin-antitoxin system VapC family toxin [Capsulimonadaceae bacterium]